MPASALLCTDGPEQAFWAAMQARERFSARWMRRLLMIHFAFYAISLAVFLIPSDTRVLSLVFLGPASLMAYRIVGSATVKLTDTEVIVMPALRRRRLPWEHIVEVGVTRGSSAAGMGFRVPYFRLDDGSVVVAQNVRSRRENSVVDRVVAAARRHLPKSPE